MTNNKTILLSLLCFFLINTGCIIAEEPSSELQEPISEQFPDCTLASQVTRSTNVIQTSNYEYEGNKLSKIYNYYNGELLTVKKFEYDESGLPILMLSAEGSSTTFKEELVFKFAKDGMPTYYARYNTTTDELIEENEYEYRNGHLRSIYKSNDVSSSEITVNTDSKGNPVSLKVTQINGEIATTDKRTVVEYGSALSPDYKKNGYIVPELFFAQNVISRITIYSDNNESTTTHSIKTETNQLLSELTKTIYQETDTLSCFYNCP